MSVYKKWHFEVHIRRQLDVSFLISVFNLHFFPCQVNRSEIIQKSTLSISVDHSLAGYDCGKLKSVL